MAKKLDWWSIMDGLDALMEYDYKGNERDSVCWDFYSEQILELSVLAADMYNELESIKTSLWYLQLPDKRIEFCDEDDCTQTIIAWWNTAACMLSDVDMTVLLENENRYCLSDEEEESEKEKRIRAMQRLTKEQYFKLQSLVLGFIIRYIDLVNAFDVITSCITELDYHQSAVSAGSELKLADAAYL